eukprot:COSAG04_NODE_298_length_17490_cov_10.214249_3_plen_172_part_00
MDGLGASWIVVPILSAGSLTPMGQLFDDEGEPSSDCDNVLLEWAAALELYTRKQVKAVMPIIACEEDGTDFSWGLPKTLRDLEHEPTLTAIKKHLRKHPSSADVEAGTDLVDGVRELVADVSGGDGASPDDALVSVSGVVNAMLRFQGILLTDRSDLNATTGEHTLPLPLS